jgi:hypothetical protein
MWIEEDGRRSGSRERTMWIEWEDDRSYRCRKEEGEEEETRN